MPINRFSLKRGPSRYALVLLLLCRFAYSTTVIVMVTPSGIVIAADGKVLSKYMGERPSAEKIDIRKIFVLHNRIAVGIVGLGGQHIDVHEASGKIVDSYDYDPASMFAEVEKQTPENVSIDSVIEAIENKFAPELQVLKTLVKNGTSEKELGVPVFMFAVAKYEGGIATLKQIRFNFDWKKREIIGPVVTTYFPQLGTRSDFGLQSFGWGTAIDDALGPTINNRAYRMVLSEAPVELGLFRAHKNLTLQQAPVLLHALLRAQHKYTPSTVAAPYRVVTLLKNGGIEGVNYSH